MKATGANRSLIILGLVLSFACRGGGDRSAQARPIVGVKIYEAAPPFDGLFREWRELGVNTLFVSEGLARTRAA